MANKTAKTHHSIKSNGTYDNLLTYLDTTTENDKNMIFEKWYNSEDDDSNGRWLFILKNPVPDQLNAILINPDENKLTLKKIISLYTEKNTSGGKRYKLTRRYKKKKNIKKYKKKF